MGKEGGNPMIYLYAYPSAFQNPGGGETLLLKTKEYLEKMGVEIKLFNLWIDRFKEGDLLHVFGSVKEALGLMQSAKSKGVKIVISPIVWYNWQSALHIPYSLSERLMCSLRQTIKSVFPQAPSDRKKMMQLADIVLAGSHAEAWQIHRYFLIPKDFIHVIPYGADRCFDGASPDLFYERFGIRDFILTVGRVEPRKNQLNLIRAMREERHPLVVIGNLVSHHRNYYERCVRESYANVYFPGYLPIDSEELRSAYAACSVLVIATWFETPSLAALEAGLAGAKVVITREGSTREYFKDYVKYVNPASVRDIREKIEDAIQTPKTDVLQNYIRKNYLWEHMAEKTLQVYKSLGMTEKTILAER